MSENQSAPSGASSVSATNRQAIEESLTGSAAEILAAMATSATAAATVAVAHINQKGQTRRAEIAADVEHARIRAGLPATPTTQADTSDS